MGYVQGGLIAVKVRGGDEGSVWYWDDDDPRDRDDYTAVEVCDKLLHRCADDFAAFWGALRPVPEWLLDVASGWVASGAACRDPGRDGRGLPAARGGGAPMTQPVAAGERHRTGPDGRARPRRPAGVLPRPSPPPTCTCRSGRPTPSREQEFVTITAVRPHVPAGVHLGGGHGAR